MIGRAVVGVAANLAAAAMGRLLVPVDFGTDVAGYHCQQVGNVTLYRNCVPVGQVADATPRPVHHTEASTLSGVPDMLNAAAMGVDQSMWTNSLAPLLTARDQTKLALDRITAALARRK